MKLSVFNNVPSSYNAHFFQALKSTERVELTAVYEGIPSKAGRRWGIAPAAGDRVAPGLLDQWRLAHSASDAGASVVFSGSYIGTRPAARRLGLRTGRGPQLYWGERLGPRRSVDPYRRFYLDGFSGVLAIGRWARLSYRLVTSPSMPVHVLPYTTGLGGTDRCLASAPTIGFVGSLVHRKGLDVLLRAMGELPLRRRPLLEVAGSGPLRPTLESLAASLGVVVEWLGELGEKELAQTRARWWAQAAPSRYDGWGVVVSEAMAAGVPVLASSTTGAGVDLVRNDFNGRLLGHESEWPEALALYGDRERVDREGANARLVGEEVSSDKAAVWLRDLLEEGRCGRERCFVTEAWGRVEDRTGRTFTSPVAAVVLNWERWDLTARAVSSLAASGRARVFVVDNGSQSEPDRSEATTIEAQATVIRNDENVGFAKGCNVGLRAAFAEPDVQVVVLVNNDCQVLCGSVDDLGVTALDPQVGLVGPKIVHEHDPSVVWYAGGRFNPVMLTGQVRGWGRRDGVAFAGVRRTGFVTGACMAVSRRSWEQVGQLPEHYFFGSEEWEHSVANVRRGLALVYDPHVVIVHRADGSHANSAPEFVYNSLRNRVVLARVLASPPHFTTWLMVYRLYSLVLLPRRLERWHSELSRRQLRCAARWAISDAVSVDPARMVTASYLAGVAERLERILHGDGRDLDLSSSTTGGPI